MKHKHIAVPDPLPAPLPGGGPRDGYQFIFNQCYYATRKVALERFAFGLAASEFAAEPKLTEDQLIALAARLYDQTNAGQPEFGPEHVDFDQEIDFWQWDPYATSYQRSQVYGYQRVPIGTGATAQPPNVVNPADLQGPPIPGKYLLVTCDANLL